MTDGTVARARAVARPPEAVPAVLRHLVRLSHEIEARPGAWAIAVYATALDWGGAGDVAERGAAETGLEGVACVDDVARAAVLALRLYARTGDGAVLDVAEHWLAFVEYMQLPDGRFCNFITDWRGTRNETGPTSIPGGSWWTARALWALGEATRITGRPEYRRAFERGWVMGRPDASDISALVLLGTIAYLRRSYDDALHRAARGMADTIASMTVDGYLVHHPGEPSIHLWGYDQVTALVDAATYFSDPSVLHPCITTAELVFKRQALEGPFRDFPPRERTGLCAYDVSPCCRGLGALYRATGRAEYAAWLGKLIAWFDGQNAAGNPLYDRAEGRCYDGIDGSVMNRNCGAEGAIEAGLVELVRLDVLAQSTSGFPGVTGLVTSAEAATTR